MYKNHVILMPRKVLTETIKRLSIELPSSEYKLLEEYCLENQETKRQVIRCLIRTLKNNRTIN